MKEDFSKSVPFDPGYYKISFSFMEQILILTSTYNQLKVHHQKKFQLTRLEPYILELINKSTAFYLGCILWGGFIHFRFKNDPKEITGNNTQDLSEKELQKLDCGTEAKAILEYIKEHDRDCKYFLGRNAKIPNDIPEILNCYIEFAKTNENFIKTYNTKDIKIPDCIKHFGNLSQNELDELCEKINEAIDSNKIENLLELGFYKK